MFYQDRGAGAMFARLSNELAEKFPKEQLNQLHDLVLGKTYINAFLFRNCIFNFFFLNVCNKIAFLLLYGNS